MATNYTDKTGLLYVITKIKGLLQNKVDKVDGKGLSTNDYTTDEKNKLAGVAAEANKYVHPTHTANESGLYKVTVDNSGHVSEATAVVKKDITDLGIPSSDTKYTHPAYTNKTNGLYKVTVDSTGHVSGTTAVAKSDITGLGIPDNDSMNTALATAVGKITSISYQKVNSLDALPATGAAGVIYLVPNGSTGKNIYDEYFYYDGKYEKKGAKDIDLDGYAQTKDFVAITNDEIDAMFN